MSTTPKKLNNNECYVDIRGFSKGVGFDFPGGIAWVGYCPTGFTDGNSYLTFSGSEGRLVDVPPNIRGLYSSPSGIVKKGYPA